LLIAAGRSRRRSKSGSAFSSITMTLDSYGHLLPGLGNALADALDAAYAGASLSAASAPLRVLTSG